MKRFLTILSVILCTALLFFGCKNTDIGIQATETKADSVNISEIGEGSTSFLLEVHDSEGNTRNITVKSDKETVGEALVENNLIDGEQGPYGLYVKSVLGIQADYDTDGAYWAFYINGEYGLTGVDQTPIDETAVYSFRYETF